MKSYKTLLFIAVVSTLMNCHKEGTAKPSSSIIYENNFESQSDIKDFIGFSQLVKSDLPIMGGDSCLLVSGGCIIPHVQFKIPIIATNTITAYAHVKGEFNGCGAIDMSIMGSDKNMSIPLGSLAWIKTESVTKLDVSAGDTILVTIISGGLKGCVSYIDNLIIESI